MHDLTRAGGRWLTAKTVEVWLGIILQVVLVAVIILGFFRLLHDLARLI